MRACVRSPRLLSLLAAGARAQAPAHLDVAVRPETVTVGAAVPADHPCARRAGPRRSPSPPAPTAAPASQALDPRAVAAEHRGRQRSTARPPTAWRRGTSGTLDLAMPDVLVRVGATVQRLPLRGLTVFVQSVLPADSSRRMPKPARDLFVGWRVPMVDSRRAGASSRSCAWIAWRRRREQAAPRRRRSRPSSARNANSRASRRSGWSRRANGDGTCRCMVEVVRDYLHGRFPARARCRSPPRNCSHEIARCANGASMNASRAC